MDRAAWDDRRTPTAVSRERLGNKLSHKEAYTKKVVFQADFVLALSCYCLPLIHTQFCINKKNLKKY